MDAAGVVQVLDAAVDAVCDALGVQADWGPSGERVGQYRSDLAADAAALAVLDEAGFGVLSEESGLRHADRDVLVVLDPLDGSTNASRGLPWFAVSLCALDAAGPLAAVVADVPGGRRYRAVRGGGATLDGVAVTPSGATRASEAVVGLSGWPPAHLGWAQYRALGALALDLCAVASGALDGFVDCSPDAHGVWDYAGALLVCQEAGACVVDALGRELVVRDPDVRRTPVAAATPALLEQLVSARGTF